MHHPRQDADICSTGSLWTSVGLQSLTRHTAEVWTQIGGAAPCRMLLSCQDVFNINFLAFCHQVQNFMADLQYLCYSTVDLTLDLPRADLISSLLNSKRGDEWSLRAFASMLSTAIFLRARAEIKNLLCEQQALLIFSTCKNPYGNPFL